MNCGCQLSADKRVLGLPNQLKPRFLLGLPDSELRAMLSAAAHRCFHRFSVVVHREDPAERFFLLTSGRGHFFVPTRNGRRILLRSLTAGQVFGGMTILPTPCEYLASTELLSNSCALVWDRKTIRGFTSRLPVLLENALAGAALEHIAWLISANVSLNCDDAEGRIAHTLISLACGTGEICPDGVEVQIRNEDLAAGSNVTPFTTSRVLNTWQREGILKKGRGKILLRRPELLATCENPYLHLEQLPLSQSQKRNRLTGT